MKQILVPIDGSDCSKKALLKARELGEAFNSHITILTIIDSIRYLDMDFKFDAVRDGIDLSKQLLASAEEDFKGYPGEIETIYKTGDVAEEIIDTAEEGNYDLIVMGSRGLGVFSRTILGSVSHKVIQHSKSTVMVVKDCGIRGE
ncbi:universal stress protein [Gudongella sp. DL1XJH-153]|uniref:universal stress protein n=1 Tax=Gudongella sp. DL1XJH-153 TaxID=3409804 RepID=UPI003BB55FFF